MTLKTILDSCLGHSRQWVRERLEDRDVTEIRMVMGKMDICLTRIDTITTLVIMEILACSKEGTNSYKRIAIENHRDVNGTKLVEFVPLKLKRLLDDAMYMQTVARLQPLLLENITLREEMDSKSLHISVPESSVYVDVLDKKKS